MLVAELLEAIVIPFFKYLSGRSGVNVVLFVFERYSTLKSGKHREISRFTIY